MCPWLSETLNPDQFLNCCIMQGNVPQSPLPKEIRIPPWFYSKCFNLSGKIAILNGFGFIYHNLKRRKLSKKGTQKNKQIGSEFYMIPNFMP